MRRDSCTLSVIIVNYNGKRFLKDCFDSLRKNLPGVDFEIVLLDNASSDGSTDYIKQYFPEVVLIDSSRNLGFGKGNNEAVRNSKGKYLLLINNDTIVLDDLSPLLEQLKNDEKIGAIGINMLDAEKRYLQACGNFPNERNMFRMKELNAISDEFVSGSFSKEKYEVNWLTGAFLLMPRRAFEQISGFDPDFFMYVEDVDLCKRLSDAGYKRLFFPRYRYIHFVGFSKSRNPLLVKGYELYISKHFSGWSKFTVSMALWVNSLVKVVKK